MNIVKKEFYEPIRERFTELVSEQTFKKEVSFALQHISKNQQLMKCDPQSVIQAVLNVAQTGLTLNPVSKYAYLIPRWNAKKQINDCILEPSYMGLVKLLTDSGSVKAIQAHTFYEGDKIDIDLATNQIRHKPYILNGKEKGNMMGVYAIATLADGQRQVEMMTKEDLHEIRDMSESYKAFKANKIRSCIWSTHESEMCRKTVLKRIFKYLPKTERVQNIEQAIQLDNQNNGFREQVDYGIQSYAFGLLENAIFSTEKEEIFLQNKIENCEFKDDMQDIIINLQDRQKESLNPSQKEISQRISDAVDRKNT